MVKTEPEIIFSFQNLVATLPKKQRKPLSDIYQIMSSFLWSHRKAFPHFLFFHICSSTPES